MVFSNPRDRSRKSDVHSVGLVSVPDVEAACGRVTASDQPSLLARIDRATYRLQNTHGLPLQPLGDGSDPEAVLCACAADRVRMLRVLCELRGAVLEQVGKDQTDRLRHAR